LDRKQCRKRKYIFLCIAGLILISLAACAPPAKTVKEEICPEPPAKTVIKEICSHRDFLRALKNSGDFENALKRSQDALSMSPKTPPGDEALFDMGLVYAHPGNPKKDYRKSVDYFKRLLKEFPRSLFVEETKVWIAVLEDIEKAMKVDIEIEEKKKELSK
jgi:tetratricopeptide (TPR) repeat protein